MAGFASAGGTTRNPWQNIPGNNAVTGAGVPVPQTGFGVFNKNTANQANKYLGGQGLPDVWGGANQRFQGLTDKIGNSLFADGAPWSGGGIWGGQFRPGPDSPLLKGYLGNLEGGGRNLMNQYIDQTAYAGPNRAGTGIVGGSDPRAAMATNAAKGFAGQYADQYGKAYDMASRDWTNMSNLWGQGLSAYGNLANTELGALRGASDYNLGQGNIGVQLNAQNLQGVGQEADNNWKYWKDITDWQRGGDQRAQQKNVWDQQNTDWMEKRQGAFGARRAQDDLRQEYKTALQNYPAYRSKFAGGGFAPEAWEEYMRVGLGMDEPLKRTLNVLPSK